MTVLTKPLKTVTTVVAATVAAVGLTLAGAGPAQAVIAGDVAAPGEFPFVGRLNATLANGVETCSASLVDRAWAITAAHCVEGVPFQDIRFTFGTTDLAEAGTQRGVDGGSLGPDGQDIALMHLASPVDDIRPVRLATPADSAMWRTGEEEIVVGWGRFILNDGVSSTRLRRAHHSVTDTAVSTDHGKIKTRPAGVSDGQWAFRGDSGGPLLHSDGAGGFTQVGVFSAFAGGKCVTALGRTKCVGVTSNRWGKVGRSGVTDWIRQTIAGS